MKNLFAVIALVFSCSTIAQNSKIKPNEEFSRNAAQALTILNSNNAQNFGSFNYKNPPRFVEGSVHLYKDWDNTAVIYTTDQQQFLLKNINLNLERNTFESKIENDQIFTFNFNNIDRFVVNNKVFKNFYWDDDSKVYEMIYEGEDFQLLKGYNITFVEGSANPMLGRKNDRYVKKPYYYQRQDGEIKKIKLRKKKILKLVDGDQAKMEMIEEYAKNNSLSFKKENDIQRILEYSAKN